MRLRGTKVSGSSLLTLLGVVCFATVMVAAVLVTSGALDFGTTTVSNGSLSLSKTSSPANNIIGNPADYAFSASVGQQLTSASLTIYINKTGILPGDLQSSGVDWNGAGQSSVTMSQNGANSLIGTFSVGTVNSGSYTCIIELYYKNPGSYDVKVMMSGTA